MRPFLLGLLIAALGLLIAALGAADAPPVTKPVPAVPTVTEQPAPIDAATAKKAEEAADAYLKQANTRPDPLAETALAEIEVLLLEVHAFIDSGKPLKAGERYLSAIEKRKTIADDQRPLLGKRLHKADGDLLALSRQLLGQPAFDLGDPPTVKPTDPAPVAGQPAK
ncbi:MAG: hypothetical protein H0W78_03360 [Planctomycetes bacterium]|nr:hypothetical protein [Planctomycetota bacterium]